MIVPCLSADVLMMTMLVRSLSCIVKPAWAIRCVRVLRPVWAIRCVRRLLSAEGYSC